MKIALVFPGYGSQHVGMGKELYDEYRVVQEYFEEASNCIDINFVKLCFASSDEEISKLLHAYTSLFLIGSAVSALLKEQGIVPDVVTGYNNGETTALFASGCFSFPDGLYLLGKMCAFYQEALETMDVAAVRIAGISGKRLEKECRMLNDDVEKISVAIYDDEHDSIVTGDSTTVQQLCNIVENEPNIRIEYLVPEIGLHSALMDTVIDQFKIYLEKVDFKDVMTPMLSGIDGKLVVHGADIKDRYIRHIREPLHFDRVLEALDAYDMIIVVTPAQHVGALLKQKYPKKIIKMISKKSDIELFKETVQ
jgi:[acyl-carrier-protein] S-malonyltransferase